MTAAPQNANVFNPEWGAAHLAPEGMEPLGKGHDDDRHGGLTKAVRPEAAETARQRAAEIRRQVDAETPAKQGGAKRAGRALTIEDFAASLRAPRGAPRGARRRAARLPA